MEQCKETRSIYGIYENTLHKIMEDLTARLEEHNEKSAEENGCKIYEHLTARIKSDESMRKKCTRRELPQDENSALRELNDAVGIRIVCKFIDDIYKNAAYIRSMEDIRVIEEKDYVADAKPNGYRSYHMIIEINVSETDGAETDGAKIAGKYLAEIQLRTIAMDTWASLEHEMKYKKSLDNASVIDDELKRCADELASCDISLQTLRNLIREDK